MKADEIDWRKLPADNLLIILGHSQWCRFSSQDFRLVCKDWRTIHDNFLPTLHLRHFPFDPSPVRHFFPNVREIFLDKCHEVVSCSGLSALQGLSRLSVLSIDGRQLNLSARGLNILETLTSLTQIDLTFNLCRNIPNVYFNESSFTATADSLKFLELNLKACKRVTPFVLASVAKLPQLTSLHLTGNKIGVASLKVLGTMTTLKDLSLLDCVGITDGLHHLSSLVSLTSLKCRRSLTWKEGENGPFALSTLTSLTSLDRGFAVDANIAELCLLRLLPRLKIFKIDISRSDVDDEYLRALSTVSGLTDLSITEKYNLDPDNAAFTNYGLEFLSTLKSLASLDIEGWKGINERGLMTLRVLTNLSVLKLGETDIQDADISPLPEFPSLTSLDLHGNEDITDLGLKTLSSLTGLRQLDLSRGYMDISFEGLASLYSSLKCCEKFDITECPPHMDDSDLAKMSAMTALRDLTLTERGCQVTEKGLDALSALTFITSFSIDNMKITNEVLRSIGTMNRLEVLEVLSDCTWLATDEGLASLGNLPLMTKLVFSGANDGVLRNISGMWQLEYISLEQCPDVTDDGISCLGNHVFLTKIILHSCTHVTDVGIETLSNLRRLVSLQLLELPNVTEKGLSALSNPSLIDLVIQDCKAIDDDVFETLAVSSTMRLKDLNLDGKQPALESTRTSNRCLRFSSGAQPLQCKWI